MERLLALSRRHQLRAHEELSRYLALDHARASTLDERLERERESLEVLAAVTAHLGHKPTAKEFDELAVKFSSAWSSAKVIRVWRYWRTGLAALDGQPPLSPEQSAAKAHLSGYRRSREDYLTAVRHWLKTSPPRETLNAYCAWARQTNEVERPERRLPHGNTIQSNLARSWPDIVRVAKGEATLEDVAAKSVSRRRDYSDGPDDLIGPGTAARICRVSVTTFGGVGADFPPPALDLDGVPAWLRRDVEAYAAGKRADWRDHGLAARYYTARELGERAAIDPRALCRPTVVAPLRTGRAGGRNYWLRREADAWLASNADRVSRRRRRRAASA